jgi:uncharacterized protein YbjT (DUF2867 family)
MSPRDVLVVGATGLVGRQLLDLLAQEETVQRVHAIVRRPPPDPPATDRVLFTVADFDNLDPDADAFRADQVFCALGTTIRAAGSQAKFRHVDFDYPLAVAQIAADRGASHFLLISALGARADSRIFYNRVKGELEDALRRLPFRSLTIARPSFLLGDRNQTRPGETIGRLLGRLAPARYRSVHARRVASALVLAARSDQPGLHVLENHDLVHTPLLD